MNRSEILQYLIENFFDGKEQNLVEVTGHTEQQVRNWVSGNVIPRKSTIDYILHCRFTPEFKVIAEFYEFDPTAKIRTQLRDMFGAYNENPGLYAFYDSMGNLLYIGKASNLLNETYDAILRDVDLRFPSGIKSAPEKRYQLVKYISAYDVGNSNWLDYPKHVESLILRISKPPLNKILGALEPAYQHESGEE